MSNTDNKSVQFGNSPRDLRQAIENLETFTLHNEAEAVPNLSHLEVKEGRLVATPYTSLKKTIKFAYSLVASTFSDPPVEEFKRSEVIDEVLHSSDIVKSYFPLIQILEDGDQEQRKFAAHARAAIERFNKIVDQAAQPPPTWGGRIAKFLYEQGGWLIGKKLTKIDLPKRASIQFDFPPVSKADGTLKKFQTKLNCPVTSPASQKVATIREAVMPFSQVSRQTIELFHMKVIAMVERHQILSTADARSLARSTPIHSSIDKTTQTCTLVQTLTPLPGQLVEVSGCFQRDPRTSAFSHPRPETFQLSTRSTQTGFPHPSQHNGWALADVLVPPCPHRPDRLSIFPQIDARKKALAPALLPHGRLYEKARIQLKIKKYCFDSNKAQLLQLHKELCLAMAAAAPKYSVNDNFPVVSEAFFTNLAALPHAFDYLAETYQSILNHSIVRPHDRLQKERLEQANGQLQSKNLAQRSEAAAGILQEELNKGLEELELAYIQASSDPERAAADFCRAMVPIFAHPMQLIVLQHLSEVMGFPPPPLNEFAKKLQICLYGQLLEFQQELEHPLHANDVYKELTESLCHEATVFKAAELEDACSVPFQIMRELENYFRERYETRP